MSSYDEQLKTYYGQGQQQVQSPYVNGSAEPAPEPVTTTTTTTMNGAPEMPVVPVPAQPPAPVAVAPPPPVPAQPQPTTTAMTTSSGAIDVNSESSGIPAAGIAFLGLPLWLLLSVQVFQGPNNMAVNTVPQAPPAPIVATAPANTLAMPQIPATGVPTAASNAGVVVLSQPITKAEVRNLFELWNDALKTGDPGTVAKRYAKDGVLLPTLSDVPRNDFEAIKDYFVGFLSKMPTGKILEGEIFVGNNWAQDAGIYEFTFNDGSKVKARYSFVYVFEDGQWMISHHHSSLMPQETVRPVKVTEQEVRGFFDLWNQALATGDPQKVADRYSKDAVLLPTLSDSARYTNERIADYFVGFLKKKPQGEILEGNIKIGPNWAQDAGIYEFTFEDGSKTKGRYSYVYTYEKGEWKISNHHSSIMPEPAVAAFKKVGELEKSAEASAAFMDKIANMEKKFAEVESKISGMEKTVSAEKAYAPSIEI